MKFELADTDEEQAQDFTEVLEEFQEKKDSYPDNWKQIYKECQEHERFTLMGKQMDANLQKTYGFKNPKMPNLLKTYINNQANQTLQNNYSPNVLPNGGGADVSKAREREYVIRGQFKNGGPQALNLARRGQLAAGIHYTRIIIDFASSKGPEKCFKYQDEPNTYSVFPSYNVVSGGSSTFADMTDYLCREDIPKDEWMQRTGEEWNYGTEKQRSVWYYWRKHSEQSDIEYLMQDGTSDYASNLKGQQDEMDMSRVSMDEMGMPYSRDIQTSTWEWYVIQEDSSRVMKNGKWLGEYPPLVACTGERVIETTGEMDEEAKVHFFPLTRDAEEPQLVYTLIENIMLLRAAKSPYSKWKIAFESVIAKQSKEYRDSAVTGEFDILFRAFTADGKAVPPPEEIPANLVDQALISWQQVQVQKIERILGIFDSSLGKTIGTDQSGKAIQELKAGADLSQYHFTFNFLEYIKQIGLVTLDAMPHYLAAPQQVAFVDKDDKAVMQLINVPGGVSFDPNEQYSLVIEVMPNSETNREAEAKALMDMAENPILGPIIQQVPGAAAIIIKAQSGRYAQQLGQMVENAANDPQKAQMAQQIQQLNGQLQQLSSQLTAKDLELKNKATAHQISASKELNRHQEKIGELTKDWTVDKFKLFIAAFEADTGRMVADGQPQNPESINPNLAKGIQDNGASQVNLSQTGAT